MIVDMSLADVCDALDLPASEGFDSIRFTGISTDTRNIQTGDLYIALKGERFNGNLFARQALSAGAIAAMVDKSVELDEAEGPVIQVESGLKALGILSGWQRDRFNGKVLAVTGSCGKTSVKQLLAHVLGNRFDTWMTQGNLNNHIGVPLTLLALESHHQAAVIEQGASGAGEIAYTGQWVKPDIGIITNASASHLSGFGSLETIVATKGEMIEEVAPEGWVILNSDDPAFDVWMQRAAGRNVKTFGLSENADVRASDIQVAIDSSTFNLHVDSEIRQVNLPLAGVHNIRNALAVAAAALLAGMTLDQVVSGMASAQPVAGRMLAKAGIRDLRLLDDSYNANPASLQAAIDVITVASDSWLVIGDMAELGEEADKAHAQIGQYAKQKGVATLLATGPLAKHAVAAFGESGAVWFKERQALVDYITENAPDGTLVLVKGSRSAGMDQVVRALQSHPEE